MVADQFIESSLRLIGMSESVLHKRSPDKPIMRIRNLAKLVASICKPRFEQVHRSCKKNGAFALGTDRECPIERLTSRGQIALKNQEAP